MAIEPATGGDWSELTARRATVLLLTGRPGVGKTTVVRRVAEKLEPRPAGFYTEEVREMGERRGFRAVTFDGEASMIADVDFGGTSRVGRYGVDVAAIDRLADTALQPRRDNTVFIIDEIGRMECLSARFVEAAQTLLDAGRLVVATVGQRGSGFIADVKRRTDAELWDVTRQNRDEIPARVLAWIAARTG
ncbi:MAG: nucleoside-triphosphatase [Vicinamibacterales bacterium]